MALLTDNYECDASEKRQILAASSIPTGNFSMLNSQDSLSIEKFRSVERQNSKQAKSMKLYEDIFRSCRVN